MIIKITTEADLFHYQEALNTQGKAIAHTICNIANKQDQSQPCEIQIHHSLLCDSYKINPAMLANHLRPRTNYMFVRGHIRTPYTVIYCTNDATPASFIKRVIQAVNDDDVLEVPVHEIPETYRYQLHLLRYKVKQYTGHKLRIRKLKTKHVYTKTA